jgi:regulation of enolase protein 1 (concanavalin A-like superfamily)
VLRHDQQNWIKLALEYSPQGQGAVVSVVTRGDSDESLSRVVYDSSLYLRISRVDRTVVLHSSRDGRWWDLERYCRFDFPETDLGFESQSPTGAGMTAHFEGIVFDASGVRDFRSGI